MEFDKKLIGRSLWNHVQKYTYNRSDYLKQNGYTVDNETRRQIWEDYKMAIQEVVNHLGKVFPDGFVRQEGEIEFTLKGISEETMVFLTNPSIDCTIKPVDDCQALMSFENGYLAEAYDLETLPNLPNKYRTPRFNGVLEGRHIIDIKKLLDSYDVLPKNNMIDVAIKEYLMRRMEKKDFVDAVIESLIFNGSEDDLTRAYLFDYFMGAQFDFEAYKGKERTK